MAHFQIRLAYLWGVMMTFGVPRLSWMWGLRAGRTRALR
jgi:hypothetical protein